MGGFVVAGILGTSSVTGERCCARRYAVGLGRVGLGLKVPVEGTLVFSSWAYFDTG